MQICIDHVDGLKINMYNQAELLSDHVDNLGLIMKSFGFGLPQILLIFSRFIALNYLVTF